MRITTILPVSRVEYLDRVLESLKNQTYTYAYLERTLIVVFDGSDDNFIKVKNKVAEMDYEEIICVKSNNDRPAEAISERRKHIANIHNQIRELIGRADWVFSVEDDGIVPPTALSNLLGICQVHHLGMATGVELGRWGVPYVGAWTVDDINDPTRVVSMESKATPQRNGIYTMESIDACGLYCAVIKADLYKSHEFTTANGLGPDVNLGLHIRRMGYRSAIMWEVHVTHLTNRHGLELEIPATDTTCNVILTKLSKDTWHQAKYSIENTGAMLKNTGQVS